MIQYNALLECSVSSQNNISQYSVSTVHVCYLLMTFLLENALPVHNLHLTCGKGGHAAQLDKAFDTITHKAMTKGPTSSVIPADVSTNPMADTPKGPGICS